MPQFNAGTTLRSPPSIAQISAAGHRPGFGVDNQIDTTTGTVKVRAQFDNSDNALFPNQFVNASFWSRRCKTSSPCRRAAIQRGSRRPAPAYVYCINADNTVAVRPISDRPDRWQLTAVNSGLAAGERVVIDGADRLRDGLHVNFRRSTNGQPPAPGNAEHRRRGRAPKPRARTRTPVAPQRRSASNGGQ